ncbi:MAG: T9SS type A sorting domain-containing protein [Bacteroidota bacterium]
MRSILNMIVISFYITFASAQDINLDRKFYESQPNSFSVEQKTSVLPPLAIQKAPGHYTKQQWRALVDSFWGPGLPTADKLKMFDDFWNLVDQKWGGFPNLIINWDSLKNVYRPEVAAGVSRGRFAAILSRLTRALNEFHTFLYDSGIDSTTRYYPYRSGVPLINIDASGYQTCFGAGLSALPDSTALVYNVIPNHPLGLQPGDVILGYDGKPWLKLYNELLDVELPILKSGAYLSSTAEAAVYLAIKSTGMNWGLFDTIDVKKYGTDQILHYPTSLLSTLTPPYYLAHDQLPVNGVPFPDYRNNKLVSWGVVSGTNIGYIYAWDWGGISIATGPLFAQAVDELMHKYNVQGLILDFRMNLGGMPFYADAGFNHLFNFDSFSNYYLAKRNPGSDHFSFSLTSFNNFLLRPLNPTPEIFDHPIAVLTGPDCISAGDFNAHRMRFHPMVRFFGLPTSGAYTALESSTDMEIGFWNKSYSYRIDHSSVYSNYNNEGYLIHKPFPVDEKVWLTRDGVAKGEDDVVKKAMEWIKAIGYAHSPNVSKTELDPEGDSVTITAVICNTLNHSISVSAMLIDANGKTADSARLYNDGLHGDGTAVDSVWGAIVRPAGENRYSIAIRSDDHVLGTFKKVPYKITLSASPNTPAIPKIIYAAQLNGLFSSLWTLESNSDTVRSIGNSSNINISGIAIRPSTSIVYGLSSNADASTLYSISSTSGVQFPVITFAVGDVVSLTFIHKDTIVVATSTGKLYRCNVNTGGAWLMSSNPELKYWSVSLSPSGKLWASARSIDNAIYVIDINTGMPNKIGSIGFEAIPRSLAFNSAGVLYCLIDNGSGEDYLATLDTTNGIATLVTGNPLNVGNLTSIAMRMDNVNSISNDRTTQLPAVFVLEQNFPNPFNPSTTISYSLPSSANVKLVVFDLLGREIATLVNEEQSAGWKEVEWNATNVSSGIYFYKLTAGSFIGVKKMLVVK